MTFPWLWRLANSPWTINLRTAWTMRAASDISVKIDHEVCIWKTLHLLQLLDLLWVDFLLMGRIRCNILVFQRNAVTSSHSCSQSCLQQCIYLGCAWSRVLTHCCFGSSLLQFVRSQIQPWVWRLCFWSLVSVEADRLKENYGGREHLGRLLFPYHYLLSRWCCFSCSTAAALNSLSRIPKRWW